MILRPERVLKPWAQGIWLLGCSSPNPGLEGKADINSLKIQAHFEKYYEERMRRMEHQRGEELFTPRAGSAEFF